MTYKNRVSIEQWIFKSLSFSLPNPPTQNPFLGFLQPWCGQQPWLNPRYPTGPFIGAFYLKDNMRSHFKIAEGFDVLPLQQSLRSKPHLYGQHGQRKDAYASPHVAMTDIWVRYNHIDNYRDLAKFNDEHDSVWYPAYREIPEIKPLVFGLMSLVQGERLGGVLITKVPPGGRIERHTDFGWHAGYYSKFYIPIQNAEGATFSFPDGVIRPQLGDVYWFDNSVPHWVDNNSDEDRISLIVCIRTELFPTQQYDKTGQPIG